MNYDELKSLRDQLIIAMAGRESHISFDAVVKDFPPPLAGAKPNGAPHTAWQLLEHMRIAQWDILEFSRNPDHKSPQFPDGYWPETAMPPDDRAWARSVKEFEKNAKQMEEVIRNGDLFTPFPHGDGQTLLREAVVLGNHNSYHLGQLAFLKKMVSGEAR
jgi:hypothetical protein